MIRVVCAIIKNKKGQYLAALRSPGMKHPGQWEFPGGKIEAEETPFEAIEREIKEELGVKVLPNRELPIYIWDYPEKKIGLVPIICELRSTGFQLKEHSKVGWFTLKQLSKIALLEADKGILKQLH